MPRSESKLLESVVHMTEERNKAALFKVLAEALSDVLDCEAVVVLRIPVGDYYSSLEEELSIPEDASRKFLQWAADGYGRQNVKLDESLFLCINSQKIITEKTGDMNRILFPIQKGNKVTGVLDIYGSDNSLMTRRLVKGFIQIYSNFYSLMDDNEHDTLTGLLNRKTFDAQLAGLIEGEDDDSGQIKQERRGIGEDEVFYWVAMLDIDHFKQVNDTFGHVYGDEVLLLFSDLMRSVFRKNDLLFRYGGEEFVVVLNPATEEDAYMVFNRFRQRLEEEVFPQVGKVTASIGMVKIGEFAHVASILEHADEALYYAKEHGRNQVCNYHELICSGLLKARDVENNIMLF